MLWGKCASIAVSAVVSGGLLVSSASAVVLYTSQGFETPPFTNNLALENQDPVNGPWVTDNTVSTATVQSAVKLSGNQAVQVTRAGNSAGDQRWAVQKPITPSLRYVTIEWDQHTLQTSQVGVNFGPLFGIEAYDAVGSSFPLIGSALVDSTTGDLLYQQQGTGFLTETGTLVPFSTWQHFGLQLDYDTSTYQIFYNGNQVVSEGFVDGPILGFSDAPIATLAGSGAPGDLGATGTAYVDNYIINVTNAPLPEPASIAIFGIAALGMLRRRR